VWYKRNVPSAVSATAKMADKNKNKSKTPKKIAAAKSTQGRMSKPQVTKPSKTSEAARPASSRDSGAAVVQVSGSQNQLGRFETGMKLFHARKLQEAREHFKAAAEGPE